MLMAMQPNLLPSPSSRSCTSTLSFDLWGSFLSIAHDEKSPYVMQLVVYKFKDATTEDSEFLYICNDISFASESSFPPQHSTSCILGIPRKWRAAIPERHRYVNGTYSKFPCPDLFTIFFISFLLLIDMHFSSQVLFGLIRLKPVIPLGSFGSPVCSRALLSEPN